MRLCYEYLPRYEYFSMFDSLTGFLGTEPTRKGEHCKVMDRIELRMYAESTGLLVRYVIELTR